MSDRTLRRWLASGRPRRVERRLEHPDVAERLDRMTKLSDADVRAIDQLTSAPVGTIDRLVSSVDVQAGRSELGVFTDLIGLGWHTAAALVAPIDGELSPDGSAE